MSNCDSKFLNKMGLNCTVEAYDFYYSAEMVTIKFLLQLSVIVMGIFEIRYMIIIVKQEFMIILT